MGFILIVILLAPAVAVMVWVLARRDTSQRELTARSQPLPVDPFAPSPPGSLGDFSARVDFTHAIMRSTRISGRVTSRHGGTALTFEGEYRQPTASPIRDGQIDASGPGGSIRLLLRGTAVEVWAGAEACGVIHAEQGIIAAPSGHPLATIDSGPFYHSGSRRFRRVDFGGRHVFLCEDRQGEVERSLFAGAWPQLNAHEQAILVGLAVALNVLPYVHRGGGL